MEPQNSAQIKIAHAWRRFRAKSAQKGVPESDEEELKEEQVMQRILDLGNEIQGNIGVEDRNENIDIYFSDAIYIQFFVVLFPNIDFNTLTEADTDEGMADNI